MTRKNVRLKPPRRGHDKHSLQEAMGILATAYFHGEPGRHVRKELTQIVDRLRSDLNPGEGTLTRFAFHVDRIDQQSRKGKPGGRPPNVAVNTALYELANLYSQNLGSQVAVSDLPATPNSFFVRFAVAALAPVLDDREAGLADCLAVRWRRARQKMRGGISKK